MTQSFPHQLRTLASFGWRGTLGVLVFLPLSITAHAIEPTRQQTKTSPPDTLSGLLQSSCIACHEGEEAEGGLDLSNLGGNLRDPKVMASWIRIHDRVRDGEMPPPDDDPLSPAEQKQFVSASASWLTRFQRHQFASQGRVRARRLTNEQLERTLQDVLGIDMPLANLLPAEQRLHTFAGIADSQSMSHFQLQYHVDLVDAALDEAFARVLRGKEETKVIMPKEIARKKPDKPSRLPELRQSLAVVWASQLSFYGQIQATTAPEDGWYEIAITASAIKKPNQHGVSCSVRSGTCQSRTPAMYWIGQFEAGDQPSTHTYTAWIQKDHRLEIRPTDRTLKSGKFKNGQVRAGEGEPQNVAGVALHKITMKRVDHKGSPEIAKQKLFGKIPVTLDRKQQRVQLSLTAKPRDLLDQLRVFIESAFRRKVTSAEAEPFVDILRRALAAKMDPTEALRATYRAVLCSPRFMFFVEPINRESKFAGAIDQHAIANRISYLLTSGPPDDHLRQLADDGELLDRYTLRDQVERMLEGDGSMQFVKSFAHEWLDLADIDFTQPDRRLFRDFDVLVKQAMLDETHLYLDELIQNNEPVRKLIDSDFTYLNNRLARHYGIKGVSGGEMKRVSLPPSSVRGGLLGHGSILKVTANGTDTSPVLRGVWISERILGETVPPPPENVPAVEPDIRGAKTIRQQLEKHVAADQCASCHRKIDPPGYALENFDPTGKWRDRYFNRNAKGKNRYLSIDPSFVMPDGRPFNNYNQFRKLAAKNDQALARNFVEKLLVYGTGAQPQFADRAAIDRIVEEARPGGYAMRSLIKATVTSPIFLSK